MTKRKSEFVTLTCPICNKDFEVVRNKRSKRKYCSYACSDEAKRIAYKGRTFVFHKLDLEKEKEICNLYTENLMPAVDIAPQFDVSIATIIRVVRKYRIERSPSEAALLCRKQHEDIYKEADAKRVGKNVGENNARYKNGSGKWSDNVLTRDAYTCQICGLTDKEIVQAHHVIPKSVDKSKRFDVDNGIALCPNCHVREHNRLRIKEE